MENDVQQIIAAQFKALPETVRNAITSANVDAQLRAMEKKYGLHVDQWALLENQIMLTVLGLAEPGDLVAGVSREVNIPTELAQTIVDDVAVTVFKPIREELERQLTHPDAVARQESGVEAAREKILAQAGVSPAQVPVEAPATTPAQVAIPVPTGNAAAQSAGATALAPVPTAPAPKEEPPQVVRAPISETYKPGVLSTERKDVHSDPYRESPR